MGICLKKKYSLAYTFKKNTKEIISTERIYLSVN